MDATFSRLAVVAGDYTNVEMYIKKEDHIISKFTVGRLCLYTIYRGLLIHSVGNVTLSKCLATGIFSLLSLANFS